MTTLTIHLDDERARALQREAERAGVSVEELARQLLSVISTPLDAANSPCSESAVVKELEELWSNLPADFVPPTDSAVEQLKHERRMKRAE